MDYRINDSEQEALYGLPYLQQLLYMRGVRPYMDFATGIVGLKRGISYQSLSEQMYVEPHTGYRGGSPSKAQLRRALDGLSRAGLIEKIAYGKQLVLKCSLATSDKNVQNKAVTKPSQQPVTSLSQITQDNSANCGTNNAKVVRLKTSKAVTPPVSGNNNTLSLTKPQRRGIHPDYQPGREVLSKANQAGCESHLSQDELLAFIAHHQSRGTLSYDWDAEYLRWLIRAKQFKQQGVTHAARKQNSSSRKQSAVDRVLAAYQQQYAEEESRIIEPAKDNEQGYRIIMAEDDEFIRQ